MQDINNSLIIKDISYSYTKGKKVLNNISTTIEEGGKITAVIGPNGTGKSTFFKCIAGLISKYEGTVLLDGMNVSRLSSSQLTKYIYYLPQSMSQRTSLTVYQSLLLAGKINNGWWIKKHELEKVSNVLKMLHLEEFSQRYVSELSGGQAQMVALGEAILKSPKVLLLDEPTSMLDIKHQLEILETIKEIAKVKSMKIMISLHDLNLACRFADQILLIKNGEQVFFGEVNDLLSNSIISETYKVNIDTLKHHSGNPLFYPTHKEKMKVIIK